MIFGEEELVANTSAVVPNLRTGFRYQFRVTAVNKAGPGSPSSSSTDVDVKDQIGLN